MKRILSPGYWVAETLEVAVANGVLGKQTPEEALTTEAQKATQLMEKNLKQFGG